MRLVDDQQGIGAARELPERVVEARVGMDDPDVRERRLGQDAGDVARRELALERLEVVELDDTRGHVEGDRRAEVAAPSHDTAVAQRDERLVDRAVVAPVEDEYLRTPGDLACEPDREAVRVGRRERELPVREPEAPRELLADPRRVLRSGA